MAEAVSDYSYGDYSKIRSYQSTGEPKSMKTTAKNLEDFIAKSPKWDGGTIYRGITVDNATASTIIAGVKAGKKFGMKGASSWTSDEYAANNFAKDNGKNGQVGIIFKTNGAKQGTSIKHLSAYPGEDEVLVSNKARWKATKYTESKGNG